MADAVIEAVKMAENFNQTGGAGRGSLPNGIAAALGQQGGGVTNDEAAIAPIQTSKRARGTTVRTETATCCQAGG